jgi:transcriptional regulator with XRE-family HTH domain
MTGTAHTIDLELPRRLRDREYRRTFFLAEASARIAAQLIALRKRRQLSQGQVAQLVGTGQPAISRAERADYQKWSFSTLRGIADALDARIRVIIEPAEDVLREYERNTARDEVENIEPTGAAAKAAALASRRLSELAEPPIHLRSTRDQSLEFGVKQ